MSKDGKRPLNETLNSAKTGPKPRGLTPEGFELNGGVIRSGRAPQGLCLCHSDLKELSGSSLERPKAEGVCSASLPTYNSKPSPETHCPISLSPGVTWEHLRLIGFCLQRAQPELHCIVGKAVHLSQPAFSQEPEMAQKPCVLQSLRTIFRTFFFFNIKTAFTCLAPHTPFQE